MCVNSSYLGLSSATWFVRISLLVVEIQVCNRSLIYLMISSYSDIDFAIVKLAQQMANLSNKHY